MNSKALLHLAVHRENMLDKVDHAATVPILVVVPSDELHKVVIQRNAGLGVEDAAALVADEVSRDDLVLSVAQDALHLTLGRRLDNSLDLLVGGRPLQAARQVDDGDVGRGHAERHARQLAVQLGDDLADGLGGARGRGDDVEGCGAAAAPVFGRGAVHRFLGRRVGVDGGHQALL